MSSKPPEQDFRDCFNIPCMKYPTCGRSLGTSCMIEGIERMDFDDPEHFIQAEECNKNNDFPYFKEK